MPPDGKWFAQWAENMAAYIKQCRVKKEKPVIVWKESNGPVLEGQACHDVVSMEPNSYSQNVSQQIKT
jgi:hypothetical protein